MKNLIIYAHPNEGSLNHQFLETIIANLHEKKQEVRVRDLYQLKFNPVLSLEDLKGQRRGIVAEEVKIEQEYISWADHILFIYPIWWTGMPALMKGFIDRVFSYGFAYRYDQGVQKGLLEGKKTTIINTQGKSNEEYERIGMDKALTLTSDQGIFTYCGLKINQHFYFGNADRASAENIEKWTAQLNFFFQNKPSLHLKEG